MMTGYLKEASRSRERNDLFILDIHVHSFCSDGLHSPEALAKYANKKGLNGIAIVDHAPKLNIDVIVKRRFRRYKYAFDRTNFIILPGIEFSFSDGHLLAIFPDFYFGFSLNGIRYISDLYDVIRDVGGVLVAAHIYRRSGLRDKVLNYVDYLDAVEVYPYSKGFKFADTLSLPCVAGSDSHTMLTLGFAVTVIRGYPSSAYEVLELIRSGEVYPVISKPYVLRRFLDVLRWFSPIYLFKGVNLC